MASEGTDSTGQPHSDSREGAYPPEWVEEGNRQGVDPVVWATTSAGAIYVAVWREFHDVASYERDLAMVHPPGMNWGPFPRDAVERVRALREARARAPEIADARWQRLAGYVWPHLAEAERMSAESILAAVRAFIPDEHPRAEARGFTEMQIRKAAETVRFQADGPPTRTAVAAELHTSESTLRRAMKELGMAVWPPAAPED